MLPPISETRVCTVILNWNQPKMTCDCVQSILAQTKADGAGNCVVVVDNGSSPDNLSLLRQTLPQPCVLIENESNLGFAGGMNSGIHYALHGDFEYVWLVNNDAFPDKDCLQTLVSRMDRDASIVAVTPRLFYLDGSDHPAGAQFEWGDGTHRILTANDLECPCNKIGTTVIGTALLLRTSALKRVGGFDPSFFMYREEDDLCARLTSAGGQMASEPMATCIHFERASTGGGASPFVCHLLTRNSFKLLRNHLTHRLCWSAMLRLTAHSLESSEGYRRKDPTLGNAVLGGIWAGWCNKKGKPKHIAAPKWFERLVTWRLYGLARCLRYTASLLAAPSSILPSGQAHRTGSFHA